MFILPQEVEAEWKVEADCTLLFLQYQKVPIMCHIIGLLFDSDDSGMMNWLFGMKMANYQDQGSGIRVIVMPSGI